MTRNPRVFAGLAAAVLTVGCLLALSLFLRSFLVTLRPAPAPAPAAPALSRPLPIAYSTPSDALGAAVAAVVQGLPDQLRALFPDRGAGQAFYDQWTGKLPSGGTVRVAQADDVNAGAEHGHLVPVTLWVEGQNAVAALTGEAEFASSPGGVQIRRLSLRQMPLAVGSWTVAEKRVGAGRLERVATPFYGVFRFRGWTVDAVSGRVERE